MEIQISNKSYKVKEARTNEEKSKGLYILNVRKGCTKEHPFSLEETVKSYTIDELAEELDGIPEFTREGLPYREKDRILPEWV